MEAIRVAREAARERARRQTLKTRIWFVASLAALALGAIAIGPRFVRWRHVRPQTATAPRAVESIPAPTATATPTVVEPTAVAAAIADAPGPSAGKPETRDGAAAAPAAIGEQPQAKPRNAVLPEKTCDTALIRSAPWRLSPDACAAAFDADPENAALALAVAHGALVRGRFADAAQWARRALSLDPKAAEAHVIIARTDVKDGRPEDARAAYARYLELAPRGWHQAEARAAVSGSQK